jgi:hypothetical protein
MAEPVVAATARRSQVGVVEAGAASYQGDDVVDGGGLVGAVWAVDLTQPSVTLEDL